MMVDVIHVDDDDDVASRVIFVVVMTLLLFSSVVVIPNLCSKIHDAFVMMMTMMMRRRLPSCRWYQSLVDAVDDKGVTVLINDNNRTHFVGFVTSHQTRCYYSCRWWCWWCHDDWSPFVWHVHPFS